MQRYLRARLTAALHYWRATRHEADPTALAITQLLGEPIATAARIARASYVQNLAFEADYDFLARAAPQQAAARIDAIICPHARDLAGALGARRQPLIIAALHMGHYLPALLHCMARVPKLRDVAILKRQGQSQREHLAYQHVAKGIRLHILRLDQRPARAALNMLRSGGAMLTMIDVPPSFGALPTRTAPFLGHHPARVPVGPATLAVAAGALVLPVASWPQGRLDVLDCAALIDARTARNESRAAAVTRVHNALAAQTARWIQAHPDAWMLWGHVAAFYAPIA